MSCSSLEKAFATTDHRCFDLRFPALDIFPYKNPVKVAETSSIEEV
jgi:hypothetical protein